MFHQRQGDRGQLAGGEGTGMDGVSESPVGGYLKAPTVRLHKTEKVTPTGVGIHAVGHTPHWRRLRPGRTGAAGNLHTGSSTGPGRGNTRYRGHTPTCETGGTRLPLSNKDGP